MVLIQLVRYFAQTLNTYINPYITLLFFFDPLSSSWKSIH